MKAATIFYGISRESLPISIHAAREGGDSGRASERHGRKISIHAAREGGDFVLHFVDRVQTISIHAAREGGDRNCIGVRFAYRDFNPRRP